MMGGPERVLVVPVETLDPAMLAALDGLAHGASRLVLSAPRLARLGAAEHRAGTLALPQLDAARIERLVLARDARVDAPVARPLGSDLAGLALMNLAALLPAFVAVPVATAASFGGAVHVHADAIDAYRKTRTGSLREISRAPVPLEGAHDSTMIVFRGGEGLRDQAAVIVGQPDLDQPVTVRLHSACLTGDVFGSLKCDCGDQLRMTARYMAEHDGGIILYLDQEGRGNGLSNKIRAYALQDEGLDTYEADAVLGFDHDQRHFDFAAAMLRQLGVSRVRLMTNNPHKIAALAEAGIEVVSAQRIQGRSTPENAGYLAAKRDQAGHSLDVDINMARAIPKRDRVAD